MNSQVMQQAAAFRQLTALPPSALQWRMSTTPCFPHNTRLAAVPGGGLTTPLYLPWPQALVPHPTMAPPSLCKQPTPNYLR